MGRSDDSEFSGRVEAAGAEAANLLLRCQSDLYAAHLERDRERERAEAAEQRLKAAEAAHSLTQRQLSEARAEDIRPYSDQLCFQISDLRTAVEGLTMATLKHDRAVLLLLDCRAFLERQRHSLDGLNCESCDSWERDRLALLERLQKVKGYQPVPAIASGQP